VSEEQIGGGIVVPAALAGERVDRAVAMLAEITRAEATQLVDSGAVALNGTQVAQRSRRLREGDVLDVELGRLVVPAATASPAADPAVPFEIVHEDADVIVVDKPVGVVTHPGAGNTDGTLVGGLLARYPELAELPAHGYGTAERPGIVHRLDKETSGLLVVARSERAYRSLVAQLAERTMGRTYLAVVTGELGAAEGVIDAPIGRSGRHRTKMAVSATGRFARTGYRVLRRFSKPVVATEVELRLETGRTHQIRVHLAAIGHPVLGDRRYGGTRGSSGVRRLMLHAATLTFDHPSGEGERVTYRSEPPAEFSEALAGFR
jgi:23S rRNA pseudouridine1911/1915/1917 synthase